MTVYINENYNVTKVEIEENEREKEIAEIIEHIDDEI